jgi:hypothetical protein
VTTFEVRLGIVEEEEEEEEEEEKEDDSSDDEEEIDTGRSTKRSRKTTTRMSSGIAAAGAEAIAAAMFKSTVEITQTLQLVRTRKTNATAISWESKNGSCISKKPRRRSAEPEWQALSLPSTTLLPPSSHLLVTNLMQGIQLHSTHKITTNSHFISTEDIHITHTHTHTHTHFWRICESGNLISSQRSSSSSSCSLWKNLFVGCCSIEQTANMCCSNGKYHHIFSKKGAVAVSLNLLQQRKGMILLVSSPKKTGFCLVPSHQGIFFLSNISSSEGFLFKIARPKKL